MQKHTIIGTAGHIDHGKTSFVRALTGIDTDYLPEEKKRGITIDIGFAYWKDSITIIDVPGHEKFIKNMVTGVCNLDFTVLIIAADDGIMPQTREHFDILNLLEIKDGIVVLTKTDLADKEWIELVKEEIKDLTKGTFLENSEIFEFSAIDESGIREIRNHILSWIEKNSEVKPSLGIFRLNVDRSFSVKGFGTVVTGTVVSGSLAVGEEVELFPQKLKTKVRKIQVHQKDVSQIQTGDRTALNLAGIEKNETKRGSVVSISEFLEPTLFLDTQIQLLKSSPISLQNRMRLRVQLATKEVFARIYFYGQKELKAGEKAFAQLRLEEPVVCLKNDKFILRRYSPEITIGGGKIVDTNPPKRKLSAPKSIETLKTLEKGTPQELVENLILHSNLDPIRTSEISAKSGFEISKVETFLTELEAEEKIFRLGKKSKTAFYHSENLISAQRKMLGLVGIFHERNPKSLGIKKAELFSKLKQIALPVLELALEKLVEEKKLKQNQNSVSLLSFAITLSEEEQKNYDKVLVSLEKFGVSTPNLEDFSKEVGVSSEQGKIFLDLLTEEGKIIWISPKFYLLKSKLEELKNKTLKFFETNDSLNVTDFKELSNCSRKNSIPLLEFFDSIGLTKRQGDVRIRN
ncbi:MAG: selenocysteine-specific translation elongation factor [Calditrichaeota bacterium]|nr:MAG: selenocysteine-specific translation elongation factor [Calditrichota bacterium]